MKIFFKILWKIAKNNLWLVTRTIKILDFELFITLAHICVYIAIVAKINLKITMIHNQNRIFVQREMVETSICLEMWCRHYVKTLYQEISLFRHVRAKSIKPWVWFLQSCTHPPIKGTHTWKGQCEDVLVQLTLLLSTYNKTWVMMDIEEVYTLVGGHFGDGCNTEKIWAKKSFSFFGKSLDRWRLMDLVIILYTPLYLWGCRSWKKTVYMIFGMTDPQAVLTCPEISNRVMWLQLKGNILWNHPTCILLQSFHLKVPPVQNFEVIVVVPFWVLI